MGLRRECAVSTEDDPDDMLRFCVERLLRGGQWTASKG
jgi:hypothetical protein